MKIPKAPDLGSPLRLALAALVVTLTMGAVLAHIYWNDLDITLGDTDDATRLVLVRGLLSGQGWWDQHLMRFQPPVGAYMHWSRLLDGAIALLDRGFQLFLSSDDAETATRFTWPLLWIFPSSLAAMLTAKRLDCGRIGAGRMAGAVVLICAVILASDTQLYLAQFHPGRLDHHDAQMTFCMLALAGAVQAWPNVRGAILAGVATGLGVAVGLEALVFEALIGVAIALRFAFAPREGRAAQAYGAALGLTTLVAFGVQTPPWRWSVAACDALALNLVAALVVASVGLIAAVALTARRPLAWRVVALALVAIAAGAVYLGVYPNCRHGFFADVDPRIRPIWLNFVTEVRPINKIWKQNPVLATEAATPWVIGVLAWIAIGFRRERRRGMAWRLNGVLLLVAAVIGANLIRMSGYTDWFAIPPLAAAGAEIAGLVPAGGVLAVLIAAGLATPVVANEATKAIARQLTRKPAAKPAVKLGGKPKPGIKGFAKARPAPKAPAPKPSEHCFDTDSYDELADAGPPGLVLSEVDLGPFVLAHTDDPALAAPYHRMSWGILQAHTILSAPADGAAQTMARQTGVAYVLECRFHSRHGDRDNLSKDSLQKRLDAGTPPAWLQPLSPADAPLQAYRVKPR